MDSLNVVYEDNHLLVVVKPQNVPTQKDSSGDLDLQTMCKNYVKQKYNKSKQTNFLVKFNNIFY